MFRYIFPSLYAIHSTSLPSFISPTSLLCEACLSRWLRPEVYPLFAAVGVAVGICRFSLVHNICINPEGEILGEVSARRTQYYSPASVGGVQIEGLMHHSVQANWERLDPEVGSTKSGGPTCIPVFFEDWNLQIRCFLQEPLSKTRSWIS
ncbi:hypothetical protein HHK36_016678 [Tetracentron sinense]|uniref:Uncharacterized protein n=1 Tax=Tetracentron sinense TaxID=13715 RepID=A0A835DC56_TETSI|nr:hypothetical protein HHK36_016678 [Tetracentron sinense]